MSKRQKQKAFKIKLDDGAEALKKTNIKIEEIGNSGVQFFAGDIHEDYLYRLNGYHLSEEIDKMYRSDANIKMLLSALIYPLKSSKWYFKKLDDSPEAETQSKFFEKAFFEHMKPTFTKFLGEALSCLRHGYSLFDITHQVVQDEELGEIITIKSLSFRKQSTILRWNLDKEGCLVKVDQQVQGDIGGLFDLDPEFLLHFAPEQEGQNYMGMSILRQCYGAWIRKNKYLQLMAVGMEKYAVPTPHMEVPATAADKKEIDKAIDALKNYSSGSNNYIVTPEGFKLTFNNVTFDSEKIKSSIQFENSEMANSILASFLLLGQGETGSRALGDSLSGFFGKSVKFISDHLIEQLTMKIMKPLAEMNFGSKLLVELCTDALDEEITTEWAGIINTLKGAGLLDASDELKELIAGKIGVNRQSQTSESGATVDLPNEAEVPEPNAEATQLAEKKKSKKKSPYAVGLANSIEQSLEDYAEPFKIIVGEMAGGYARSLVKESVALSPAAKSKAPVNATPPNQAKVRKFLEMISVIHFFEAQKKVAPLFKGGDKKKLADPKPSIKLAKVDDAIEEFIKKARGLLDATNYSDAVAEVGSVLDKNLPMLYGYVPSHAKAEIKSRADILASINSGDIQKYIDLAYDKKTGLSEDDLKWAMDEAVDDYLDRPSVIQGFDSYLVKSVNDSLSQAAEDYEKETGIEILSYTSYSVLDDGTTDLCYELDGVTWSVDDPDLDKYWPPSHFGCRRINTPNTSAMKDIPEITGTPKLSIKAQGQLQFSEKCSCTYKLGGPGSGRKPEGGSKKDDSQEETTDGTGDGVGFDRGMDNYDDGVDPSSVVENKIPVSSAQALNDYKANSDHINPALRVDTTDKDTLAEVAKIDKAMNSSKLTKNVTVHRLLDAEHFGDPESLVGKTLHDKGYMSTSTSKQMAKDFNGVVGYNKPMIMVIEAPAGSKAINMDNIRGESKEGIRTNFKQQEILFARGSSLEVTHVTKEGKHTYVHAKLKQN